MLIYRNDNNDDKCKAELRGEVLVVTFDATQEEFPVFTDGRRPTWAEDLCGMISREAAMLAARNVQGLLGVDDGVLLPRMKFDTEGWEPTAGSMSTDDLPKLTLLLEHVAERTRKAWQMEFRQAIGMEK